jgi:hypothetical protein
MESVELLRILDEIKSLQGQLKELKESQDAPRPATQSSELNELFAALAKSQAEMQIAGLHAENPYFKSRYADLATIVRVSRPYLTKNGLSVIQKVLTNPEGQSILHTILGHSSGQWLETQMRIVPAKNDVQTLGSYITYLRRYSYAALVGVVSSDEDDDGERAVADHRKEAERGVALNTKYNAKEQSLDTINKQQLDELEYELSDPDFADITQQILDGLRIQALADMPATKYRAAIERVRTIKMARSGVK